MARRANGVATRTLQDRPAHGFEADRALQHPQKRRFKGRRLLFRLARLPSLPFPFPCFAGVAIVAAMVHCPAPRTIMATLAAKYTMYFEVHTWCTSPKSRLRTIV
jgi:hypothetical protein